MFNVLNKFSAARIYRIGISFVLSFIVINIAVSALLPSYENIGRASEILLDDNVCNFVEKDFQDIEKKILNDDKQKIFLLGDSISYGIGVKDESQAISGYLQYNYSFKSVYNLASCGSKPLDYYLWVKYLSSIDPRDDSIYLIQYNYKWFNVDNGKLEDRLSQKRIAYRFLEYLDDETAEDLGFRPSFFEDIGNSLSSTIPVSSNKLKLFAAITKQKSKEDFIESVVFGKDGKKTFKYKSQNWQEKQETRIFNCKIAYSKNEWNPEENFNLRTYQNTLEIINERELNALVFLPAYNNELIKKCQNDTFESNVTWFLTEAKKHSVQTASYVNLIDESHFLDDMHLDFEGNRKLVELMNF